MCLLNVNLLELFLSFVVMRTKFYEQKLLVKTCKNLVTCKGIPQLHGIAKGKGFATVGGSMLI